MQLLQLERELQAGSEEQLDQTSWDVLQTVLPTESGWVRLYFAPTPFSEDEALLLCHCCNGYWLAWVPGYGEILLNSDEFYWAE